MNIEITKSNRIVLKSDESMADVTLETPIFSESKAAKRLTKYYKKAEASFLEYLQKLPNPLNVPVEVCFSITQNEDDLLSLFRDITIGTNRIRIADTWKNGYPIKLKSLGVKKRDIIKKCTEDAEILERSGYISMYPNYRKLIKKRYRPECFYIQDGNIIVFYEAGALASKSHGIIKFSIS